MYSVERPGASRSYQPYVDITWDTPALYMIILKVFGKLLLPMWSDLMAQKTYSYRNGFSVTWSAFLPDDTGVAALMLVTAARPCHEYPLPLLPPSIPLEHPLPEVLFLTIPPIVTFIY